MSARSTSLKDAEDGAMARVDRISEHVGFIDVVHHRIHQGRLYTANATDEALADDASIDVLIQPPVGTFAHTRIRSVVGGDARLEVFEGTTFSVAGTALPAVNRNRVTLGGGPNVATNVLTTGPTITDVGLTLFSLVVAGGTGFFTAGSQTNDFFEVVLDPGQVYLIRLTNLSGGANPFSSIVDFYE